MNIVILDRKTLGDDLNVMVYETLGNLTIYNTTKDFEVEERIKEADVVIVNKVNLSEKNLRNAKNLKLICLTATGTNNIDLNYAKMARIGVCNVAGYSTESVAQHTFAMLFYVLEHLRYYDEYVKSGGYTNNYSFCHLEKNFYGLYGRKFGIIGLGAIGKKVGRIAKEFGSEVLYYSTSFKNDSTEFKRVSLETLLKECSIVSIHAPLNEKTLNLINYEKLKLMNKDSIIINVGRGGIINEYDLAKALDEDIIRGAAVDVLTKEPVDEKNPLLSVKNKEKILITPHIAWATIEARNKVISEVYENIEAFYKGELRNRVV